MTLLVDQLLWHHRERRWCHLVSDDSLDELHQFAAELGLPRRLFHGDHYDLPDAHRDAAVAAGAIEVSSRELVARLRAAGLRLTATARREAQAAAAASTDSVRRPDHAGN